MRERAFCVISSPMLLERFPEVQSLDPKDKWRLIDELWCHLVRQTHDLLHVSRLFGFANHELRDICSRNKESARRKGAVHDAVGVRDWAIGEARRAVAGARPITFAGFVADFRPNRYP